MSCQEPKFTNLRPIDVNETLARKLIPTADRLRDLFTSFGLRPYEVAVVRTRWSGGERGLGFEEVVSEVPILPTPKISDLSSLTEVVNPVGLTELGGIQLSEVSGRYTEAQLRGFDANSAEPGPDEQVYFEVRFLQPPDGVQRRRFFMRSAPYYAADEFHWILRLEKAVEDRTPDGEPR